MVVRLLLVSLFLCFSVRHSFAQDKNKSFVLKDLTISEELWKRGCYPLYDRERFLLTVLKLNSLDLNSAKKLPPGKRIYYPANCSHKKLSLKNSNLTHSENQGLSLNFDYQLATETLIGKDLSNNSVGVIAFRPVHQITLKTEFAWNNNFSLGTEIWLKHLASATYQGKVISLDRDWYYSFAMNGELKSQFILLGLKLGQTPLYSYYFEDIDTIRLESADTSMASPKIGIFFIKEKNTFAANYHYLYLSPIKTPHLQFSSSQGYLAEIILRRSFSSQFHFKTIVNYQTIYFKSQYLSNQLVHAGINFGFDYAFN